MRPLLAVLACLAYIAGPFVVMQVLVIGPSGAGSTPGEAIMLGPLCFAWLVSAPMAVPAIWRGIRDGF